MATIVAQGPAVHAISPPISVVFTGTQPSPGNKIIVGLSFSAATSTVTVIDNASSPNTYTQAISINNATVIQISSIYYLDLPGGATWSGNYTITITGTAANYYCGSAIAYSGVVTGAATATNSNAPGTSSATATTGAVSLAGNGLYAAVMSNQGATVNSVAASFTLEQTAFETIDGYGYADIAEGTGSRNASFTLSATEFYAGVIAAWNDSGAPPPAIAGQVAHAAAV